MFLGTKRAWTDYELDFDIPNDIDCAAQIIELIHDSRSASEEFISGSAWFDNLKLIRLAK